MTVCYLSNFDLCANAAGVRTIRVRFLEFDLLAEVFLARGGVSTAGLSVECLATIASQPLRQGSPCIVNVVRDTLRVGAPRRVAYGQYTLRDDEYNSKHSDARVVRVQVLVNIEDEVGDAAVRVDDFVQGIGRAVRDELASGSVIVSGQQDELCRRTV